MATHITFRDAAQVGGSSVLAKPRQAETISESATSQATTITALSGEIAHIEASAAVHIAVGQSPTAVSGEGDLIQAGGSKDIGPLNVGDTVAVITQ